MIFGSNLTDGTSKSAYNTVLFNSNNCTSIYCCMIYQFNINWLDRIHIYHST